MNIKDQLRDAIQDGNWDGVTSFYEQMFGEKISTPGISDKAEELDVKGIRTLLQNALALTGHNDRVEYSKEQEDFIEIDHRDDSKNQGGVQFISSEEFDLPEDDIDGYDQAVQEHRKKRRRSVREDYVPNLAKCRSCGIEFDSNKEYPVGTLDSSRGLKCNRCRTSS